MPSYKMLRTNMGGYEVFNLDSPTIAAFFKIYVATSQVDDVTTVFTLGGDSFFAGSVAMYLGGIRQNNFVETNPATGTITVTPAPLVTDGPLEFTYIAG